jgi:hypothetical protein
LQTHAARLEARCTYEPFRLNCLITRAGACVAPPTCIILPIAIPTGTEATSQTPRKSTILSTMNPSPNSGLKALPYRRNGANLRPQAGLKAVMPIT